MLSEQQARDILTLIDERVRSPQCSDAESEVWRVARREIAYLGGLITPPPGWVSFQSKSKRQREVERLEKMLHTGGKVGSDKG